MKILFTEAKPNYALPDICSEFINQFLKLQVVLSQFAELCFTSRLGFSQLLFFVPKVTCF